jgi:DNA-binding CsgD family transcriptional regulator/PAS domain-containing protein
MANTRSRALADSAVGALYAAAEDEALWPEALGLVSNAVGALGGALYAMNERMEIGWCASQGIDLDLLARYSGHYAANDLKMIGSFREPNRLNVEGVTQERPSWYEGSEIDVEIYAAAGVKYSMSVIMQADDGASWIFAHHAPRDRGMFSTEEMRWYGGLAAHAVRALRLDLVRRREIGRSGALAAAFDRLDAAILLVGPDGRVVEANAAAEALLDRRHGLRLVAGKLWPDDADARRRLHEVLGRCGRRLDTDALPHAGEALAVPRPERRPLHLRVVPLGLGASLAHPRAASAMVLVSDPEATGAGEAEAAARMLGLTPAEARVAALLASGRTPRAIAEQLGMSIETVRTYLKRGMSRAEVHRQSDLVRLLTSPVRLSRP